ncbi:MAG: hypothetical protein EXS36_00660 [Pedosphaera sp.]|nr:hypothetical protein [Pedosphaera sp.]
MRHPRVLVVGYFGHNNYGDELTLRAIQDAFRRIYPAGRIVTQHSGKRLGHRAFKDFLEATRSVAIVFGGGNLFQSQSSRRSFYFYLSLLIFSRLLLKPTIALSQGVGPLSRVEGLLLDLVAWRMPWVSRDGTAPRFARVINGADWTELLTPHCGLSFDAQGNSRHFEGIGHADILRVPVTASRIGTDRFHIYLMATRRGIPVEATQKVEKLESYLRFHRNRSNSELVRLANRNIKLLRWLLRWQPVVDLPHEGILYSFNPLAVWHLSPIGMRLRQGIVDGIGLKMIPRFWGATGVRGVDLVNRILKNGNPEAIVVWGTKTKVLDHLPSGIKRYSGFENEMPQAEIEDRVVRHNPKFVILCQNSPRQDQLAEGLARRLPHTLILPAGGSIDAIFGFAPYVPIWVHALGVEWLVRMLAQPSRILRLPRIFGGILKALIWMR